MECEYEKMRNMITNQTKIIKLTSRGPDKLQKTIIHVIHVNKSYKTQEEKKLKKELGLKLQRSLKPYHYIYTEK